MTIYLDSLKRDQFRNWAARASRCNTHALPPVCAALIWILIACAVPSTMSAEQDDKATTPERVATSGPHTAPVELDGHALFQVRGISAYPAEQRALTIAGRIEEIAADPSFSTQELRTVEGDGQTRIQAGDIVVMTVFDGDAAMEGVPRQMLADFYVTRIRDAIAEYRHDRTPRAILFNGLTAAGVTLLAVVVIFLIVRASRRLEHMLERRYRARIQGLRIQTLQLVEAEKLWRGIHTAIHVARAAAILVTLLEYADRVFRLYPWTRPLAKRGIALFLDPLRMIAMAILAAVPNLVFIAILIVVVRYLLKLTHLVFSGIERGRVTISSFDREWAWPTYKIVRVVVIAFGLVVAYPFIPGSNSGAFKGISIFLGVVFSLGSTSAVANIIAGYTMTYRRAFKVGDRIRVLDLIGDVVQIRLQVTHLRSLKNEEIVIPNLQILNSHVVNYSRLAKDHGLILHTTVGIGYDTPWRQVESMLLMAAARTPGLLREPPPFVLKDKLGDFCVTYEINVYCDRPQESLELYSALHQNILDVFNEYGVQIMTPAYMHDPARAKVVPKEKWFEAPARSRDHSAPNDSGNDRNTGPGVDIASIL